METEKYAMPRKKPVVETRNSNWEMNMNKCYVCMKI